MEKQGKVAPEFIAILGMGVGSSFCRGSNKDKAVNDCARIAVSDWSSMFDLAGKEAKIAVFDVSGLGDLYWEADLVPTEHGSGAKAPLIEVQIVKLPKARR